MKGDIKKKLDSLLIEAMNAEVEAKKFYEGAARKAASAAGRNLFTELAEFEQGHYDRLKEIISARNKGMKFEAQVRSKAITVQSEVKGQFEPNKDEIIKVLNMGIEAEKKAQAKYREIAKMSEDAEFRNIFNDIADEERKHQRILEDQFYHMSNKGRIIWGE
jgi:rubrerythrin